MIKEAEFQVSKNLGMLLYSKVNLKIYDGLENLNQTQPIYPSSKLFILSQTFYNRQRFWIQIKWICSSKSKSKVAAASSEKID